jgi:hypothetical protein
MIRKLGLLLLVFVLSLALAVPAFADGPAFSPQIYADGVAWGTKGNGPLPAPNEDNRQSFDGLYKFTNGVDGQLPVAEAAPMNPAYNGGRWIEYFVTFTGTPELVKSYSHLSALEDAGLVTIVETGNYFQCPLLPTK